MLQTTQLNGEIIASIFILSIASLAGWVSYFIIGQRFSRWAQKTETKLDDDVLGALKTIIFISIIVVGIQYALMPLSFLQPYETQLSAVFWVIEILLGAFAVTRVSNVLTDWYANRNQRTDRKNSNHLLFLLKKIIQFLVFVFAFLIILYIFNVDLTGAIVGLGVGGIAIAFAIQNQLGDVLGAFSIYFDRPFEIGDFIIIGEHSGTVTSIGVKSTRIKLLQGEELVIPNKELTSVSVRNFRKLEKRRVVFSVGIDYKTSLVKLRKIPGIIKQIIEAVDSAEVERVNFTEFGDFSLKFLVIYYVSSADYGKYLDTQQAINFAIKEAFESEEIEIAFPTSAVYLKKCD
jgi:small-conductance mechanosensitive channel